MKPKKTRILAQSNTTLSTLIDGLLRSITWGLSSVFLALNTVPLSGIAFPSNDKMTWGILRSSCSFYRSCFHSALPVLRSTRKPSNELCCKCKAKVDKSPSSPSVDILFENYKRVNKRDVKNKPE